MEDKKTIQWKVYGGLAFDHRTPQNIMDIIIKLRADGMRVRFHWGDQDTGEDWGDTYDVEGRVYASAARVPILVHNNRSQGGCSILTHRIVKIETTRDKRILYQHPLYHVKHYEVGHEEGVLGGFLESLQVQEVHS